MVKLNSGMNGEVYEGKERLSILINPEWTDADKLEYQAAEDITGIRESDWKEAQSFYGAFPTIAEFVLGCEFLITFNGDFDCQVLEYALRRYGLQWRFPWPPRHIDVMKESKSILNIQSKSGDGSKFPNLKELANWCFGNNYDWKAHRAVHDAEVTLDCYIHLVQEGYL